MNMKLTYCAGAKLGKPFAIHKKRNFRPSVLPSFHPHCKWLVAPRASANKSIRQSLNKAISAYTLFEMLIALALFALIAAGIARVTTATIQATRAVMDNHVAEEQLSSFLRATRRAFFNLPAGATIELRYDSFNRTPELVFIGASTPFGLPVFDGGELILSARMQDDRTRTFSLLRIPPNASAGDISRLRAPANWLPLLRGVDAVEWEIAQGEEWESEWEGEQRPQLVRLRFTMLEQNETIEAIFRIPPATTPPRADSFMNPDENNPRPRPTPTPPEE